MPYGLRPYARAQYGLRLLVAAILPTQRGCLAVSFSHADCAIDFAQAACAVSFASGAVAIGYESPTATVAFMSPDCTITFEEC